MAIEQKAEEPDFEDENMIVRIKSLPIILSRKADDGNTYGNLYQVTHYDKKSGIETLYVFSKGYNNPLHEHMQQKENRNKENR